MRSYGTSEQLKERRQRAFKLLKEGKSVEEVAKQMKVTVQSVYAGSKNKNNRSPKVNDSQTSQPICGCGDCWRGWAGAARKSNGEPSNAMTRRSQIGNVESGPGEKKWRVLKATLVIIDEAGFSLVSPLNRSWSPRGQTPTARTSLDHHQRLNLFGAMLISPKLRRIRLSVRSFLCNLRSEHTIIFLEQVLRLVPGHIILLWNSHKIHIAPCIQEFIEDRPRLHVSRFPTCAPELNPVEFVWTEIGEYTAGFGPHNIQELYDRCRLALLVPKPRRKDYWLV